jgi:2-keto-3-deoxy-6-phosphogluconate aldolase
VGGSWLVPLHLIQSGQWSALTHLARQATDIAQSVAHEAV